MADMRMYLGVCLVFLVLVAPLYMMFRFLVKIVRTYYGFADVEDEGPPLRICQSCHNTVMEDDFVVCPYCGVPLPLRAGSAPGLEIAEEKAAETVGPDEP